MAGTFFLSFIILKLFQDNLSRINVIIIIIIFQNVSFSFFLEKKRFKKKKKMHSSTWLI